MLWKFRKQGSIETKIMAPFLFLVVVSILLVGSVAIWSTAAYDRQLAYKELDERIETTLAVLELLNSHVLSGTIEAEEARHTALRTLAENELIFLYDRDGSLIQGDPEGRLPARWPAGEIADRHVIVVSETFYSDRRYIFLPFPPWGWQVGSAVAIDWFAGAMLEIQKYTLLIAVAASLLAVQATIVISHSLSRPIKKLAGVLNRVNMDDLPNLAKETAKLAELRRHDEIGSLSRSFADMVHRLNRSNRQLVELKRHLESILSSSSLGNLTWQAETEQITLNRRGRQILGLEEEEGSAAAARKDPVLRYLLALCRKCYREKEEIHRERGFSSGGGTLVLEINAAPLRDEEETVRGATCSFQDITERKEMEEQMERLERLAFLGEMSAGLAHEIRNPLAGMKACAQVIAKNYPLDEEGRTLIKGITGEIDRVNALISDLLQFSSPSAVEKQAIDLNTVITETAGLVKKQIADKGVNLQVALEAGLPTLYADGKHLKQILLNLLLNAIWAAPEGGRAAITAACQGPGVSISVSDNGIGIPPENLKKIFHPFFTTRHDGTGMGLAVVHKLVNLCGGQVEIKSTYPGGGTTITVKLK